MSGMIVERRDQVLITRFSPREFRSSTFLSRWSSTNGPFLTLRLNEYSPPCPTCPAAPDDQALRRLAGVAGATFGLAPGRHRVTAARRLALPATQGVVDGVHGHAPGLGTDAAPAVAAGLALGDQLRLGVADLADRGATVDGHATHLGAGQAQGGEVALLGHQL